MDSSIRVELPILPSSTIVSKYKTIGDLRKAYIKLRFVKYVFVDPNDGNLKGFNPHDKLPIVENSYVTVIGDAEEIAKFAADSTKNANHLCNYA